MDLQSHRGRRTRTRVGLTVAVVLGVAVAVALAAVIANRHRDPTLITKPGTYVSPGGASRVVVTPAPDGTIDYAFSKSGPLYASQSNSSLTPRSGWNWLSPPDWFMAWDAEDNLWVFDPGMEVVRVSYAARHMAGTRSPDEYGGWEGVPPAFLACLPEKLQYQHAFAHRKFPDFWMTIDLKGNGPPTHLSACNRRARNDVVWTRVELGPSFGLDVTYLRTTAAGDEYEVTQRFPLDTPTPKTKTVVYNGTPLTVFEDDSQHIQFLSRDDLDEKEQNAVFGPVPAGEPAALRSDPPDLVGARLSAVKRSFACDEPIEIRQEWAEWTMALNWQPAYGTDMASGALSERGADGNGWKFWKVVVNGTEYPFTGMLLNPQRGIGGIHDLRTDLVDGPAWGPGMYRVQFIVRDLPVVRLHVPDEIFVPRLIASNEVRFEVTDRPSSFTPVVMRTLTYAPGDRSDSAISFERNELITPPAEMDIGQDARQRDALGIDAWLVVSGGEFCLHFSEIRVFEAPDDAFDLATPNEVRKLIGTAGGLEVNGGLDPVKHAGKTFAFVTGAHQMGLLDIVRAGPSRDRQGCTVRYKFLRRGAEADKIVATATPVDASMPDTWRWRIDCDVPVQIVHGLVIVGKGEVFAHGGHLYRNEDREVEVRVIRKDGLLHLEHAIGQLSAGTDKTTAAYPLPTHETRNEVRDHTPVGLPADAPLTVRLASPACTLTTGKLTPLWEGEFTDGENPPRRVIFAARIEPWDAPKGVPFDPAKK